jgi:DNA-binding response OmpR family regulator
LTSDTGGAKPLVLIVDDDATNLKVAIDALEAVDCEVIIARSGEAGLARAAFATPELILLDVQMPGMDGFETCRLLKGDRLTADIPVIFMTVRSEMADKVAGFAAGGVDYVTKPLEVAEVVARVKTHLTIRGLQRALREHNRALELRVHERTAELHAANQALRAEAEQRLAHQREKDRLLEVVREQAEQLRALTNELLASQREKQQALIDTLRDRTERKLDGLGAGIQLIQRLLETEVNAGPRSARLDDSLAGAERLVVDLRADLSAVRDDLSQPIAGSENALLKLSAREREVVQLLGAGKSPAEIACLMVVSVSTV